MIKYIPNCVLRVKAKKHIPKKKNISTHSRFPPVWHIHVLALGKVGHCIHETRLEVRNQLGDRELVLN